MNKNPFEEDENPFADPSVTKITGTHAGATSSGTTGFEDYNPFADDNASKPSDYSDVTIPPPQPSEPAVIDARPEQSNAAYSAIAAEQENLAKRQEELEKRAVELQKKEEELKTMKYRDRKNNFPPFPSFCPLQPCFFHDISVDIPPDFQRTSKMLFYAWEFYCFTMLYNVICALAYLIEDGGDGLTTFIVALIFFLLFLPCSFCLWYRPSYNAFKNDSSFSFMVFFFILFFQIIFNVLACLGIDKIGSCGFINGSKLMERKTAGEKLWD
ncbi:secretory carrier-associated membrane protein 1-like [Xenia sp. Carnegie-2017]|uniref:secretory carrier-associated membrane protein 1-like n=1 Tax=Xenia sp. Carnegie-2017 TaxID=2897299 RepID=UPI001F03CD35|nr:secretory carrier-associated membrane protein 1-like [Xenia sp. Carnegie-2017]